MLSGPPVVIATNGKGFPVRSVTANAPLLTVAGSGMGAPIIISDLGSPFIVQGLYVPEALALFSRFTTPPTPARKSSINGLIVSLIDSGVWSDLDALYLTAASDEQSAGRNWISNTYNLSPVSAPTFVMDKGYAGNGVSSYLETGFNPTTAIAPRFTQNNAHMGIWSLTNLSNAGGVSAEIGSFGNSQINRNGATETIAGRPNTASGVQIAPANSFPGHVMWSRSADVLWEGYANGNDVGGAATVSAIPANSSFRICGAATSSYGMNQIAAAHWGRNLTAQDVSVLYNAISTYLVSVGAV